MKLRWLTLVLVLLVIPSLSLARWITDQVVIQSEATGPILFSHYNHLEAVGKNCPTCHNGIFNIDPGKNPTASMADMEQGKSCGACHNGSRAFGVKEDCSSCHPTRDITFTVADAGNAVFSHDLHTGMYSCSECHPGLFIPGSGNKRASMEDMAGGESCGACHDGSTAFTVADNCDSCHQM